MITQPLLTNFLLSLNMRPAVTTANDDIWLVACEEWRERKGERYFVSCGAFCSNGSLVRGFVLRIGCVGCVATSRSVYNWAGVNSIDKYRKKCYT